MAQTAEHNADGQFQTEAAYTRLRNAILQGELQVGVPISRAQLVSRFGINRTPLREAVRMLQSEGLIHSEPNRRLTIAPLSVDDLESCYAQRILIDALAIRLSVAAFTTEELAELQRLIDEMDAVTADHDVERWEASHRRYHALLRSHGGERIAATGAELGDHSDRYRRVYLAEPRVWTSASEEHEAILSACVDKDAALAAARLARHYARTALTVIAQVDEQHEPRAVRLAVQIVLSSSGEQKRTAQPHGKDIL